MANPFNLNLITWIFFIVTKLWAILSLWLAGCKLLCVLLVWLLLAVLGKYCSELFDVSQQLQWVVFWYSECQDSRAWQQPSCLPVSNLTLADTLGLWLLNRSYSFNMPVWVLCHATVLVEYISKSNPSCICEHTCIFFFFPGEKYLFASWHIAELLSNVDILVCILILNKCLIRFFPPAQEQ